MNYRVSISVPVFPGEDRMVSAERSHTWYQRFRRRFVCHRNKLSSGQRAMCMSPIEMEGRWVKGMGPPDRTEYTDSSRQRPSTESSTPLLRIY